MLIKDVFFSKNITLKMVKRHCLHKITKLSDQKQVFALVIFTSSSSDVETLMTSENINEILYIHPKYVLVLLFLFSFHFKGGLINAQ